MPEDLNGPASPDKNANDINNNPTNLTGESPTSTPNSAPTSSTNVVPTGSKPSRRWWLIIMVVAILILLGTLWGLLGKSKTAKTSTTAKSPAFRIGLSLDTYKELRWEKDRDFMMQRTKQLGGSMSVLVADSNDQTQISQIENFISQKVDVLIVVPHDAEAIAPAIEEAHKAGIKIISYDRLVLNSAIDLYLSFDNVKVGKEEAQGVMDAAATSKTPLDVALVDGAPTDHNATLVKQGNMSVLQPLVDSGKVKIVYDRASPDWSPDAAYTNLKAFLDGGGKVDAVVAANDGTAGGAIKALKEHALDGKVPVSGQDAELAAVQRLVAGTQSVTVYKPLNKIAYKAIDIAAQFVKGKKPDSNGTVNNGKIDAASYLLDPVAVTKTNIKTTIIQDGVYTSSEVYGSAAK